MNKETIYKVKLIRKLDCIYTTLLSLICASSLIFCVAIIPSIIDLMNIEPSAVIAVVLIAVYTAFSALFIIVCMAVFNKILLRLFYVISKNKLEMSVDEFMCALQNDFYDINGFYITTTFSIDESLEEDKKYMLNLGPKSFNISKENYDIIKNSNNKILCIDLNEYKKDNNPNFELI